MASPVVVARFSFPHEAQIARASLEAAGIPAIVADHHTINMQWLYSDAIGGVKVLVPPDRRIEAEEILSTDFSSQLEAQFGRDSVVCPGCGGSKVVQFTQGKKSAFVVFLLLGFPLFFYKHGMKCDDCDRFWET